MADLINVQVTSEMGLDNSVDNLGASFGNAHI
jgi:hypothetical protein